MTLVFKIAVWVLVGLHLMKPFVPVDLTMVIGAFAALVILSGLTVMGRSYKKVTLIFLLSGSAMLVYFGEPVAVWLTAAGTLTNALLFLS